MWRGEGATWALAGRTVRVETEICTVFSAWLEAGGGRRRSEHVRLWGEGGEDTGLGASPQAREGDGRARGRYRCRTEQQFPGAFWGRASGVH